MKYLLKIILFFFANLSAFNSFGQNKDIKLRYPLVVNTFYTIYEENPVKYDDNKLFLLFARSLDSVFNFNQGITQIGKQTKISLYDSTITFENLNLIDTISHQRTIIGGLTWGAKDEYKRVSQINNIYCIDRYCDIIQPKISYILSKYKVKTDCDYYLSNFLISLTCPTCGVFNTNENNDFSGDLHFHKMRGTECVIYRDFVTSDSVKIKAGATLVKIENIPTQLLPYKLIVTQLLSRKDSSTKLMIKQNDKILFCQYKFHRDTVKDFDYRKINDSIGVLKLNSFSRSGFTSEIRSLLISDSLKVKKLIVDLRQCPGGLLIEAIRFCDLFLGENYLIGEQIGARKNYWTNAKNISHTDNVLSEAEIFILTDTITSSGAEIIAGALKIHKRARIIGQGTSATGVIMQTRPLYGVSGHLIAIYISDYLIAGKYKLGKESVLPDEYVVPTGDSDNLFEYVLKKCL